VPNCKDGAPGAIPERGSDLNYIGKAAAASAIFFVFNLQTRVTEKPNENA
jgi:hypothetical protein